MDEAGSSDLSFEVNYKLSILYRQCKKKFLDLGYAEEKGRGAAGGPDTLTSVVYP